MIFRSMKPRTEKLPTFKDEQLNMLKMPVFAILGGQDVTMDSGRIRNRFEQYIQHAEVLLYQDGHHYVGDQSAVIADFLRRTCRGGEMND